MTNWELLEQKITDSGLRRDFIYDKLGVTRAGWSYKKTHDVDFTQTQIARLCEVLSIDDLNEKEDIFFAKM